MTTIRILSYNVQGCKNSGAIFQLINRCQADYVALQNIQDLPYGQTMEVMAAFCGMKTASSQSRHLGLLCRQPVKYSQTYDLGAGARCMRAELVLKDTRCLLYNIAFQGGIHKRWGQLRRLYGPDVLGSSALLLPTLLLGDFLDVFYLAGAFPLKRRMLRLSPPFYQGTYPALWPVIPRDRAYGRDGIYVEKSFIDRSDEAKKGSNHLPVILEIRIVDSRMALTDEEVSKASPAGVFSG